MHVEHTGYGNVDLDGEAGLENGKHVELSQDGQLEAETGLTRDVASS